MNKTAGRRWTIGVIPVLILAVTGILLAAYSNHTNNLKARTFQSLVLSLQQQTGVELERLFSPIITQISISKTRLQGGAPPLENPARLNESFMPVLRQLPQISSALLANSDGRAYMLLRTGNGWVTRLTDVPSGAGKVRWQRWTEDGQPMETWEEELDYDPRKRPWFRGAVDSESPSTLHWTRPYRFFTSDAPGITVATSWPTADGGEKKTVLGFDVLLTSVSEVTRQLRAGEGGKTFVLTGGGQVIGVPAGAQFEDADTVQASVLTDAGSFMVPEVRDAYAAWISQGRPASTPFVFHSDRATWWSSFRRHPLGNRAIWYSVIIPESDLLAHLGGKNNPVPAIIIAIGLLLFAASILLVRRLSGHTAARGIEREQPTGPDRRPGGGKDVAEEIRGLISEGEHEYLEFKSTVRWNIKAGRTGKEIELAWLKTVVAFLNTDGGTILMGVDDQGEILGLPNDGFANDDQLFRHIENLISRHIGNACFPYVKVRLANFDDRKVVMIRCTASVKPVFLKHDKGEDFYLRTGPASRSLSSREVLAYLETRKVP